VTVPDMQTDLGIRLRTSSQSSEWAQEVSLTRFGFLWIIERGSRFVQSVFKTDLVIQFLTMMELPQMLMEYGGGGYSWRSVRAT